jgi:hypothetical protein
MQSYSPLLVGAPSPDTAAACGIACRVGGIAPVIHVERPEYSAPDDYVGQEVWVPQHDDGTSSPTSVARGRSNDITVGPDRQVYITNDRGPVIETQPRADTIARRARPQADWLESARTATVCRELRA